MNENCSLVAVTSIIVYGYPDWNTNAVPLEVQLVEHADEIRTVAFPQVVGWIVVGLGKYAP